jgi:hypothetical protein
VSSCLFPDPVPFGFDLLRLVGARQSKPPVFDVLYISLRAKIVTTVLENNGKVNQESFLVVFDLRG